MEQYKRTANKLCLYCGAPFYCSPSQSDSVFCCSKDCGDRLAHKNGTRVYWKCIEEERNIDLVEWIREQHITKERTILDIAQELSVPRITIMRWCKMWGIETRTVSEDNFRRYSHMTKVEIDAQTSAANKKTRDLFSNVEWKTKKCRDLLAAQNFRESKPERAIKQSLIDHGYGDFEAQYQLGYYSIDIAYPDIKLAIEIDGEYWHSLPRVARKDKSKNGYIQNYCGWNLLRIPATPCLKQPNKMVWEIIQHIETIKQEEKYEVS